MALNLIARARPHAWLRFVTTLLLLIALLAGCSSTPATTSPTVAPAPKVAALAEATLASSPGPGTPPLAAAPSPTRRLSVVATTTQVQDFVRNVGGDRIDLVAILKPGVDPHDYQPTAEDARKLAQADVVFYSGVELEPWIEDLARNARSQVPLRNLAESAGLTIRAAERDEEEAAQDEEPQHGHASGDPHVWYDPTNVQKMVEVIRATLSSQEPAGASVFAANAAAYHRQLDQLDQQIKQQIATIPPEQRRLVTSHESYRYYADRYGLEYLGAVIPSISSEAEPSAAELQELIRAIREHQVKAIFTERGGNPRLEQRVAQQAGVKVISDLYAETLGPAGSEADTYLKAMQHNTRLIVEGLR